ncbi:IclR family transcriptional regulator [Virgibacillus soli]|uniref:IclR family transcriptional regulator n=1 Tax=Paracerasibacillus soli TaxID=480284 RepID=A0ABU5CMC9_9BACI|nr:IclR family transcriptional regulator [Virgibacillus soli]MDY0407522.1 IclR family transcriptional regulator [Virgibacillus soli]
MNQSVAKALQLLDLFTEEQPEWSLKDISKQSGIPKPTAYRLLTTLESGNFVFKMKTTEHDSRYRLGLKLLEMGQLVSEQLEVRKIALPFMQMLANDINEVIHLVIVNQNKAVYIEKVENTRALRLYTKVGKSTPLYMGSGPKLLLAHLPIDKQREIFREVGNKQLRDGRVIDERRLREELVEIRKQGFSYSVGEQDPYTTGISYPIFDYRGHVISALTVSGLSSYFEGDNLRRIKNQTEVTARQVSRKLGFN